MWPSQNVMKTLFFYLYPSFGSITDGNSPERRENLAWRARVCAGQGVARGLPRGRGVRQDHPLGLQEPCQAPYKEAGQNKTKKLLYELDGLAPLVTDPL